MSRLPPSFSLIFFFIHTPTTEIYTLSLHDALPISGHLCPGARRSEAALSRAGVERRALPAHRDRQDRKSTRLNSSHLGISYAVFCLKKKKKSTTKTYGHKCEYDDAPSALDHTAQHC